MSYVKALKGWDSPHGIIQSQAELELGEQLNEVDKNLLSKKYSTARLSKEINKVLIVRFNALFSILLLISMVLVF